MSAVVASGVGNGNNRRDIGDRNSGTDDRRMLRRGGKFTKWVYVH